MKSAKSNCFSSLKLPVLLFVGIFLSSCSATKKLQDNLAKSLETAPEFQQGFAGFALYDPEEKKMLFEHNSRKYFTPASNTKLFTFYTGLKILGDSVPALEYAIVNDSLIFTGTGDPSFLNPDLPESKVFDFLKNRNERLYYLLPFYTEKNFGPGWAWDDYASSYSVERTPFPVFGNRVSFIFEEGKEKPIVEPSIFTDSLFISDKKRYATRVGRQMSRNKFDYHNFKKDKDFTQDVPFKYSSGLFIKVLSDSLQKEVNILEKAPKNIQLDQKLYSISADSLYKRMLKESDNLIAEQILLMAANEISDTLKSTIAIDYMKENFLQDLPDEPVWRDGSGLSRYNLFTPRTIVGLLEKIREEVPEEKLLGMMATGGKSGTLKNTYKAEEPYIFAKTGTLSNNHSLSGFLKTKSGKTLIFSFLNSNYTIPTPVLKAGMEDILLMVRDHY